MRQSSLLTRTVLGLGVSVLFMFESWQHYGWLGPILIASGVAVIIVIALLFGRTGPEDRLVVGVVRERWRNRSS